MKLFFGLVMMIVSMSACASKESKTAANEVSEKGVAEAQQAAEEAKAEAPGGVSKGEQGPTGPELMKQGWKQTAKCPGHEYSYLVEKAGKRMVCSGVSGYAGPLEYACKPFTGKVSEFKKCAKK